MENRAYILMGRSGSGKGTQAALLNKYLEDKGQEVLYVETGAKFREVAKGDSLTSKSVKEIIETGSLAPAFLPINFWSGYLIDNYTGSESVIFDGIARRIYEAHILDSAIRFYFTTKAVVISVDVSDDWATQHLLARGRADDNEKDIRARLAWYQKDVELVLEFFDNDSDHFEFYKIDGEQSIEEVHQDIIKNVFN